MARVEIVITVDDEEGPTISGTRFTGIETMQSMEELGPHACMAYAISVVHSFHAEVDRKQQESKSLIQPARALRMARG